ncbi:hypothetical protein [Amycolatopsis sp. H20-H5]|uniref:hypothetical protein n=1 Tax=Amycolatopsis sp. H20-H5 TaxID=3046309 RepID=UPI002DB8EF41|nr:hypothetical protein [Amycolatopsis sp. H20-H5]MEC3981986.1 hypothetical protein [Amycolatopsis sp. H20-H5]
MDPLTDLRTRRRAGARLATLALAVVVVAGVAVSLVVAHHATTAAGLPTPHPPTSSRAVPVEPGWDLAGQAALATRPMLALPITAAQPHELTTQAAGPDIVLPAATPAAVTAGRWIADTFPGTAAGAVAQLRAIDQAGAAGGDPATYSRAYQQFALPGAPDVRHSGLHVVLTHLRDSAGIPPGQLTPGLELTYDVTHGLIKGTADHGRYVVVCTLGQLSLTRQGRTTVVGIGDCQALRWTGTGWRISPGARAAYATSAWPGSAESVAAGYRALSGGQR